MSAVWLKITTILCLCCTELTDARVMWKEAGQSITIPCTSDSQQQMMSLMKGLNRDEQIFFTEKTKQKPNIKDTMKVRVQTHVVFPKVEVLIKNLTRNDTGPYWCLYKNMSSGEIRYTDSLLLVVTEKQQERTAAAVCESSSVNVVVLAVVAFSAALLAIMLFLVLWITKKNTRASICPEKTSRRLKNNDVYEDMRGTIRR